MKKLKAYGCILLGMMGCYILGLYTVSIKYDIHEVEPHQWFLTSFFALMFIICGIKSIKKI